MRPCGPYLALLPVGLAVPLLLPTVRWSLTPPFHPYPCRHGRSVFCGAFPRVSPAGRYPAPSFCGVRTFLAAQGHAAIQPSAQGIFMRSEAVGQRGIEYHHVDGPLSQISYQDDFFQQQTHETGSEVGLCVESICRNWKIVLFKECLAKRSTANFTKTSAVFVWGNRAPATAY